MTGYDYWKGEWLKSIICKKLLILTLNFKRASLIYNFLLIKKKIKYSSLDFIFYFYRVNYIQ